MLGALCIAGAFYRALYRHDLPNQGPLRSKKKSLLLCCILLRLSCLLPLAAAMPLCILSRLCRLCFFTAEMSCSACSALHPVTWHCRGFCAANCMFFQSCFAAAVRFCLAAATDLTDGPRRQSERRDRFRDAASPIEPPAPCTVKEMLPLASFVPLTPVESEMSPDDESFDEPVASVIEPDACALSPLVILTVPL